MSRWLLKRKNNRWQRIKKQILIKYIVEREEQNKLASWKSVTKIRLRLKSNEGTAGGIFES